MPERFVFREVDYRDVGTFLRDGAVRSKNHASPQTCHQTSYQNLVNRRGTDIFEMPGGGVVNDYVAFYFSPFTSFTCAIHRGCVTVIDPDGVTIGPSRLEDRVFLVCQVAAIAEADLHCCFSDYALNSNALQPKITDDLTQIEQHVHWGVFDDKPIEPGTIIPEIGYTGVCRFFSSRATPPKYQTRKEMRMAEFLVEGAVPLDLVACIVVPNGEKAALVQREMGSSCWSIPIFTKPGFFVL